MDTLSRRSTAQARAAAHHPHVHLNWGVLAITAASLAFWLSVSLVLN